MGSEMCIRDRLLLIGALPAYAAISVGTNTDFTVTDYHVDNDRDGWSAEDGQSYSISLRSYPTLVQTGIVISNNEAVVLNESANWTGDWSGISSLQVVASHGDSDYIDYAMRIALSSTGNDADPWAVTGNSATLTLAKNSQDQTLTFDLSELEIWQGDGSATPETILGNVAQVRLYYNSVFTHAGQTVSAGDGGQWVLHSVTAVPEPRTFALLLGTAALLTVSLRRRA